MVGSGTEVGVSEGFVVGGLGEAEGDGGLRLWENRGVSSW